MARIRTIKPSFVTDLRVGKLSREARLFFILLWTDSDDDGIVLAGAKRLAGVLYPHDDDVTPEMVTRWKEELVRQGMTLPYVVEGTEYLVIRTFTTNQRVPSPTPSLHPAPPPELFANDSRIGDDSDANGTQPNSSLIGNRNGNRNGRARKRVPTKFDLTPELRAWAKEKSPTVDVEAETQRWLRYCEANGKGYVNHEAAWKNWIDRARDYQRNGNGQVTAVKPWYEN